MIHLIILLLSLKVTAKIAKKTVKPDKIKQNLEQKNQVESEISSVNEFKKKSFETEKKILR